MKQKDIKDLTDKQLKEMISDEELNLTRMRLAHSVSPMENPIKLATTRKLIARLKTEARQRQIKSSETAK